MSFPNPGIVRFTSKRSICGAALSLLLAAGCVSTSEQKAQPVQPGQAPAAAVSGISLTLASLGANPRSPLGVDDAHSVVHLPEIRARLRSIVERLLRELPSDARRSYTPDVFIVSDGFGARVTSAGDILVGIGLVAEVFDEDSMAFVLAHELMHLYEDHLSDERETTELDSVITKLLAVLAAAQEISIELRKSDVPVDAGDLGALEDAVAALVASINGLQAIQSGVISPAYSRDQELRADAGALRLLVAAGYNPEGAYEVIENVGEAQQQLAGHTVRAIRTASNSAKVIFKIGQKYGAGGSSGFLPFDPTELVFEIATATTVGVFCEFAETHPDKEDRIEQITEILAEELTGPFPDFLEAEWSPVLGDATLEAAFKDVVSSIELRNKLFELVAKADPLVSAEGCVEEQTAQAREDVQRDGERLIGSLSKQAESQEAEKVDISAELGDLGSDALKKLKALRAEGVGNRPFTWAAFADIRAKQERLDDTSENLLIGLKDDGAEPLLLKNLSLSYAKAGKQNDAAKTVDRIGDMFGPEWLPPLALRLAILAKNRTGVVQAAHDCSLASDYFVRENCIKTGLEFRKELDEMGVDPDSYRSPDDTEKGFFEDLFS